MFLVPLCWGELLRLLERSATGAGRRPSAFGACRRLSAFGACRRFLFALPILVGDIMLSSLMATFPESELLKGERKVRDRAAKENRRAGTKARKQASRATRTEAPDFLDQIICGDSEELLARLPDHSVDIVLTSPPYNFGLDYAGADGTQNDAVDWDLYFAKLDNVWRQCARVLVDGGRMLVNVQPLFSDYIPTHHRISEQLRQLGLLWKGEILWEKNNYNCKYTAWGSWKSPSMPYLKYTWEFVEIFCKATHKKTGNRADIDITGDEFKKWVYAKWSIAPERRMKDYDHPAMFPEELVLRLLKLFSYQGDVVLDPFSGAGTTAAMAKASGRHFIGLDISEQYCQMARERVAKVSQLDVSVVEGQADAQ